MTDLFELSDETGAAAQMRSHPEPYYDEQGRFIHRCWCGAWGLYGFDYEPRRDRLGKWFCDEHKPERKEQ